MKHISTKKMGNKGLLFSVVYQREHVWIAMKFKICYSFISKNPVLESCLPKDCCQYLGILRKLLLQWFSKLENRISAFQLSVVITASALLKSFRWQKNWSLSPVSASAQMQTWPGCCGHHFWGCSCCCVWSSLLTVQLPPLLQSGHRRGAAHGPVAGVPPFCGSEVLALWAVPCQPPGWGRALRVRLP